jgi:hypothetical protein
MASLVIDEAASWFFNLATILPGRGAELRAVILWANEHANRDDWEHFCKCVELGYPSVDMVKCWSMDMKLPPGKRRRAAFVAPRSVQVPRLVLKGGLAGEKEKPATS